MKTRQPLDSNITKINIKPNEKISVEQQSKKLTLTQQLINLNDDSLVEFGLNPYLTSKNNFSEDGDDERNSNESFQISFDAKHQTSKILTGEKGHSLQLQPDEYLDMTSFYPSSNDENQKIRSGDFADDEKSFSFEKIKAKSGKNLENKSFINNIQETLDGMNLKDKENSEISFTTGKEIKECIKLMSIHHMKKLNEFKLKSNKNIQLQSLIYEGEIKNLKAKIAEQEKELAKVSQHKSLIENWVKCIFREFELQMRLGMLKGDIIISLDKICKALENPNQHKLSMIYQQFILSVSKNFKKILKDDN